MLTLYVTHLFAEEVERKLRNRMGRTTAAVALSIA